MPPKSTNVKKIPRSGRLRKVAENEEPQEVEPVNDKASDAAPNNENGASNEVSNEDKPGISEENVNGKVEETAAVATKQVRQKAKVFKASNDKKAKTNEISSDEIASTDVEPEKVPDESADKKTQDQTSAEEEKVKSDEGVHSENSATAKPAKASGKRGQKKAVEVAKQDVLEAVAGPSKRSQRNKPDSAATELVAEADDDDFAPRKTRGGRSVKDNSKEVAPVAKGRKRKAIDQKAEVKETKKGKVEEEAIRKHSSLQIDDIRQLRVDIQRNVELDEMAKNSSKEEEEIEDEQKGNKEDLKVKDAKGESKSVLKRGNKNAKDAKPAKVQKKDIDDTTSFDFENTSKTTDGKPWNFKVVSWNINGIRAWLEKDGLSYLHHEKPDVMCFQETKCSEAKLPSELKKIEGYHWHFLAGEKEGYSGVGMLFKNKPISIKDGIGIEEHDNEGRVITAEFEKFYLVTTYVPNSSRGLTRLANRMKFDVDFRAYLKKLDIEKPVILCGDLNVAHEEIDLANPKTNKKNAGFTQEERDGFSALLEEGFVDTFRHLYPDTKDAYTFWTYMMNARAKNVGWRLDYFVVSKRFTDHLCDNVIRKSILGSDHCPIVLFLNV